MRLPRVRKYKVYLLFFLISLLHLLFPLNILSIHKRFFSLLKWSGERSDFLRAVLFRVTFYEYYSLTQNIAESFSFLFFSFYVFCIPFFHAFYLRYTRLSPNNPSTESAPKTCSQSLWKLVCLFLNVVHVSFLHFFLHTVRTHVYRILNVN